MAAIRAAAKWGRWDHVDGLLQDVDKLGVEAPVPKGRRGKTPMRQVPDAAVRRELGSECYAYLVKAYAQAMLWTHAIDVYREKLLPRWEEDGKEPLTYQVKFCRHRAWYFLWTTRVLRFYSVLICPVLLFSVLLTQGCFLQHVCEVLSRKNGREKFNEVDFGNLMTYLLCRARSPRCTQACWKRAWLRVTV